MKFQVFTKEGKLVGELNSYQVELTDAVEDAGFRVKEITETSYRVPSMGSVGGQMVKAMIAAYEKNLSAD